MWFGFTIQSGLRTLHEILFQSKVLEAYGLIALELVARDIGSESSLCVMKCVSVKSPYNFSLFEYLFCIFVFFWPLLLTIRTLLPLLWLGFELLQFRLGIRMGKADVNLGFDWFELIFIYVAIIVFVGSLHCDWSNLTLSWKFQLFGASWAVFLSCP